LACIDGSLDEIELKLISRIAKKGGLKDTELKRIIERPESIAFLVPTNQAEKIEQIYDMVLVMMADGEIHEREVRFCKGTAIKLGINQIVVDLIVKNVIDMITKGLETEIALRQLLALINKTK